MTTLELKRAQLEAVKKTLSMWSWLYEHPDERKKIFFKKRCQKHRSAFYMIAIYASFQKR